METLYVGKEYMQAFLGFFCEEKTVCRGSRGHVCTHTLTHKQIRANTHVCPHVCALWVGMAGMMLGIQAVLHAPAVALGFHVMDGENAGQGEHHTDPPRSLPRKTSNHITLSSPCRSQFLFAFLLLRGPLANQKPPVPSGNALYCRRP